MYYTVKSKSRKWKLVAFYYILDTARINAATMFALKHKENPKKVKSFEIGFELVKSLIIPNIQRRPLRGLRMNVRKKMSYVLGEDLQREEVAAAPNNILPKMGESKRNCRKCLDSIQGEGYAEKKKKLNSSKAQCQKCGIALCTAHGVYIRSAHIEI